MAIGIDTNIEVIVVYLLFYHDETKLMINKQTLAI